jgi:hypothetical protein
MELPTRRLDEMTSREVELYLKAGGDLIFVPFGPISGHGAFTTLGIHAHWAEALSTILARKADGLVYPAVFQVYAGAPASFRGTVSFSIIEQVKVLYRVASLLYAQGFKRVVLVSGTTPETTGGIVAARALFDETGVPFWLVEAERALAREEVRALVAGYEGNFGETLIDHASLRILGRTRPIPCAGWAAEPKADDGEGDQPAEIFPDVRTLRQWGAVGFRYYQERNHGNHGTVGMTFGGKSDIDLAVSVLEKSAEAIAPALESYSRYIEWIEKNPFKYVQANERLDEPL